LHRSRQRPVGDFQQQVKMVEHEDVGMQRHAIVVAIALKALQIGAVIRVVMEDRGAAIPAARR